MTRPYTHIAKVLSDIMTSRPHEWIKDCPFLFVSFLTISGIVSS